MTTEHISNKDLESFLLSITDDIKCQDKELNVIRKELNDNIRETIAFKATNSSQNKKAMDKSTYFKDNTLQDIKVIQRDFQNQIRDEKSEFYMLSKKINLIEEDIAKIKSLKNNLEERIKICEEIVGMQEK